MAETIKKVNCKYHPKYTQKQGSYVVCNVIENKKTCPHGKLDYISWMMGTENIPVCKSKGLVEIAETPVNDSESGSDSKKSSKLAKT